MGIVDPVTLLVLNCHPYAVERGRSTQNNIGLLVPVEKDTSSCSFTADCDAWPGGEHTGRASVVPQRNCGETTEVETSILPGTLGAAVSALPDILCPASGEKRKF